MKILNEFEEYLIKKGNAINTVETYVQQVKDFIRWYRINSDRDFENEMLRSNFLDHRKFLESERGDSLSSLKVKTHALKNFNEFLIGQNYQQYRVVLNKDVINLYESSLDIYIPTDEEIVEFSNRILREEGIRDYAIVILLKNTGLKISECLKLKLDDVDLSGKRIKVRDNGNEVRVVPINDDTVTVIKSYLKKRPNDLNIDYLFISKFKKEINRTRVNQIFNKHSETITPQTLRHYYCIKELQKGTSVEKLAEKVGNISIQLTRKYEKLIQEIDT